MDLDDDRGPAYRNVPLPAGYGSDQREMRESTRGVPMAAGRHVVSTYPPPETSYAGYAVAPTASSAIYDQPGTMPRILQQSSGSTPPPGSSRAVPAGYGSSGYPPNTQVTRQPAPAAYDSRQVPQGAGYGIYQEPRADRHASRR